MVNELRGSIVNLFLSLNNDVLSSDVLFLILVTTGGAWSYLIPRRFATHWLVSFVDPNVARKQCEGIETPSSKLWSSYCVNEILWLKI